MSDELHRVKTCSSESVTVLWFVPRISIDLRIHCPRTFTKEFPAPPPPTQHYVEKALSAAGNIIVALWSHRHYIEVIKVGYSLGEASPKVLLMTSEIVLIVPVSGEKIRVKGEPATMVSLYDHPDALALAEPDSEFETAYNFLAHNLLDRTKRVVQSRQLGFTRSADELRDFVASFADIE